MSIGIYVLYMGVVPWTPQNTTMKHENTPLEKEKHRPKPPIFGFHVSFRGCTSNPEKKQTSLFVGHKDAAIWHERGCEAPRDPAAVGLGFCEA